MQSALEPINTDYNNYHSRKRLKQQQDPILPPSIDKRAKTAYVQLADTVTELCHSLVVFKSLKEKGAKKEMIVLYPKEWEVKILREGSESNDRQPREEENIETGEQNWSEVRRLLRMGADMGVKCRGVVDVLSRKCTP
jgi:hypothetical protein